MQADVDFDDLEAALRRCGSNWNAAQSHGLLSSRLAVEGARAGHEWLQQVLADSNEDSALRFECETLLNSVYQVTLQQLSERLSDFQPLLPTDDEPAVVRTTALAHWCEGFLHGLVSIRHDDATRQRLAEEPLSEVIADMLQITRAEVDDAEDGETNEAAYAELVEYLRVATQLTYEELADRRRSGDAK